MRYYPTVKHTVKVTEYKVCMQPTSTVMQHEKKKKMAKGKTLSVYLAL